MSALTRATPDQARSLFEIMVRATEVGCARAYPAEIIAIWHKGRSAEGMAVVIANEDVYSLSDAGRIRGFVHIDGSQIVGLFVDPADHGRGFGRQLFRFARDKIAQRPILVKATLNAVPFYAKLGFRAVATESVRRHGHDIYVVRMELDDLKRR
jgi:GNAT superfamily N-acetyltransferase